MLSRSQRLSSAEFSQAFEKGRVLRHRFLQLRVHRRDEGRKVQGREFEGQGKVRAAFVSPKKLGKAVQRNRLRRRVRERYRLLQQEYSTGKLVGCDLIFLVGDGVEKSSAEEIDAALHEILQRAARR